MKLAAYLSSTDVSRDDFARRIGVSGVSVHRYISGVRIPRPDTMARIVAATGGAVQPNDFFLSQDEAA